MNKSSDRWPDFLMIGAPKAGTTALFKAICRHPKIYMPRSKEPRYFSYPDIYPSFIGPGTEKNKRRIFHARQAYLQLFADCPLNFITGEASTQYLGDHSAAEEAFKHIPFCRLIAILRHPVDRAYSQYLHQRHEGLESAPTFEQAWNENDRRIAENWRPALCYRSHGFYARHLKRWLEYYSREQLLIIFYEDWRKNPVDTLEHAWDHLGVKPLPNPTITDENVSSRQPRWAWLHHRMSDNDNPLRRLAQHSLPLWARDAVTATVQSVNLRPGPRLDPELRARLARTYHDDLTELEALTGRDLSHWRS